MKTRIGCDPSDPAVIVKMRDRTSRQAIWIKVRDGVVVGAFGCEPERFMGLTEAQARTVARKTPKSEGR